MRALLLAALLTFSFVDCAPSFENTAIVRTVDLGGSLVHVTTTYAAKALDGSADVYTIALGPEERSKTSWLEAKVKGQQNQLQIHEQPIDSNSKFQLLDIQLPKTLKKDDTINIVLDSVQTQATWPWPERAGQDEDQGLKYKTDLLVLSPYKTLVQRTKLKSSSPTVHSYTTPKFANKFTLDAPVTKSGATVTYGPFNNIPESSNDDFVGKSQESVTIHYNYDYPVLELKRLNRAAEISHWGGNLNIQDDISLHNAGPALKGHFSRLQHQSQSFYQRLAPHIINGLALHLPPGIQNMYYYDQIGNVSTSHLRSAPSVPKNAKSNQYSLFEMKPRYPIMGGWNYTFTLGWDSPLTDSASYDRSTGKYLVEIPIMTHIPTAVVAEGELRVVLPEGATNIDFSLPFRAASNWLTTHTTYLDTIGRPALVFKYKNLTDKHAQTIFVSYKVPLTAHLQKPLAVATAFFSLFLFATVARRLDLSIPKAKIV